MREKDRGRNIPYPLCIFHKVSHNPVPSYLHFKRRREGPPAVLSWACVRANGECSSSVLLQFCLLHLSTILAGGLA